MKKVDTLPLASPSMNTLTFVWYICYSECTSVDALLLTKVWNLFRLVTFVYPVSFFLCLRIPFGIPHHILLSRPLGSSWLFPRLGLLFGEVTVLRNTCDVLCRLLPYWKSWLAVFATARWGLWIWRRKPSAVKGHLYHITSRAPTANRIYHC